MTSSALRTVHINTERTWRGGEQQTLYLAKGLFARGQRVEIVAQPRSPMAEKARSAGLSVTELAMRGEGDVFAVARLVKLLKRLDAQIVHMHTSHAHTLGCLASVAAGKGLRIVSRRVDFTIFRNRLKLSRFKYGRMVNRYIAISEAVRRALIDDGIASERISIVNSGIDLARHPLLSDVEIEERRLAIRNELGVDVKAPIVLNVAHFGWHKAQEVLVEAAPRILEAHPDALILFAGEGKLLEAVKEEARRLGVLESVRFLGFRDDINTLIDAADVFVMCSVMEGLCTSLLDSLARRTPVVASEAGGMPEIVEDGKNGYLAAPRDAGALADRILRLLASPEDRAVFGVAGREKVERRFSVDSMVEGSLGVYRQMMDGGFEAAVSSVSSEMKEGRAIR